MRERICYKIPIEQSTPPPIDRNKNKNMETSTRFQERGDYIEYGGTRADKKRMLELPPQAVAYVVQVLIGIGNKTEGLNQFQFRSPLVPHIPMWILLYGLIFSLGIVMNMRLIHWITRAPNVKTCTAHRFLLHLFLGNSFSDLLIKDIIVLPVSFSTLTGVHWVLGRNFCKFFPIVQDSCFYSSSLILLCSFIMRFRHISKSSFHSGTRVIEYQSSIRHHSSIIFLVICFGVSLCAIIPHTVYIEFVDLGYYFGDPLAGSGVCFLLKNNIIDYVKYLFIIFYVVPVCVSLSYHFKTSDIIEKWSDSSEDTVKTKRLTIHRGSLIETSSFINSDPNADKDNPIPGNKKSDAIRFHEATASSTTNYKIHDVPIILTSRDGDELRDLHGRRRSSDERRNSSRDRLNLQLNSNDYRSCERSPGSLGSGSRRDDGRNMPNSRFDSGNTSLRFQSDTSRGSVHRVQGRREIARQRQQQLQQGQNHGLENQERIQQQREEEDDERQRKESLNRIRSHNSSLRIMKASAGASSSATAASAGFSINSGNMAGVQSVHRVDQNTSAGMGYEFRDLDEEAGGRVRRNTINFYPSSMKEEENQKLLINQRNAGCNFMNVTGGSGSGIQTQTVFSRNKSSSFIDRTNIAHNASGDIRRCSQRFLMQEPQQQQQQQDCNDGKQELGYSDSSSMRMLYHEADHAHHQRHRQQNIATSYRSRNPEDMIIHSNPVHDYTMSGKKPSLPSPSSSFHNQDEENGGRQEILQDVRIDDVLQRVRSISHANANDDDSDGDDDDEDGDSQVNPSALRASLDQEELVQKMMGRILLFHSLLLLPMNILRFVKFLVPRMDATLTLDVAYLVFVGMTFSTILVVPVVLFTGFAVSYSESLTRFHCDEDQRRMQQQSR